MTNKHPHTTFNDFFAENMKNPVLRAEYTKLDNDPEFALMDAMVIAQKRGLTQAEIAKRMGTTQSAISRSLSGTVNPSIAFLRRFAKAIGMELKIQFV